MALVGRMHRCIPKVQPERVDNVINEAPAVRDKVAQSAAVINKMDRFEGAVSSAERQAKWRAANRDLHRQRSRESMRKLRSKAEAN